MNIPSDYFFQQSSIRWLNILKNGFVTLSPHSFKKSTEMIDGINARDSLIIKLLDEQSMLQKRLDQIKGRLQSKPQAMLNQSLQNQQFWGSELNKKQMLSFSSSSQADHIEDNLCVKKEQSQTNITESPLTEKEIELTGAEINSTTSNQKQKKQEKYQKYQKKGKKSEAKNVVKNFAKAIFGYIRKNRGKKAAVLSRLEISEEDFDRVYEGRRGRIHSIAELRGLWSAEGNSFPTAFRVLSSQYLRAHCLARTFNSRVENFAIHLKYRKRLILALEDPTAFTALKTD